MPRRSASSSGEGAARALAAPGARGRALELQILQRGLLGPELARAASLAGAGAANRHGNAADGGFGGGAGGARPRALLAGAQPLFRRVDVGGPPGVGGGGVGGARGGALVTTAGGGARGARGHVATDSLTAGLQLIVLDKSAPTAAADGAAAAAPPREQAATA